MNASKRLKKLPDDVIILDEHEIINSVTVLQTEDLGKKFEMAICLLYNITYEGKYKYSINDASILKNRIIKLLDVFPYQLKHTAKAGSQYDFTCITDDTIKLSAKTTKKDGKVCPQVIGQPSKKKFCEYFGIDNSISLDEIKTYIQTNITNLLSEYFDLTFDCPIIYFNQSTNKLLLIKVNEIIDWTNYNIEFSHIKKGKVWGESSTITINGISIGEFQVHNHRDNIKFRWCFEKLIKEFQTNFDITCL